MKREKEKREGMREETDGAGRTRKEKDLIISAERGREDKGTGRRRRRR